MSAVEVWSEDNCRQVEYLLRKRKLKPNVRFADGTTALHRMARDGCVNCVEVVLAHPHTRIDIVDDDMCTALHYAASCAHFENAIECAKLLLRAGCEVNAESDSAYPTALFVAVQQKNVRLAEYLLEQGADVDLKSRYENYKYTILTTLLSDHRDYEDDELEELVALLLYYNVDVNWPFGPNAFRKAACNGRAVITKLLCYHFIADCGEFDDIEDLLTFSFCLSNDLSLHHWLFLLNAIEFNASELIEVLLESSSIVNPTIFNYLHHDKLYLSNEATNIVCSRLNDFFGFGLMRKAVFLHTVEQLLDFQFAVNFDVSTISFAYLVLLKEVRPKINLDRDELAQVLCQMFLLRDEIESVWLFRVFQVLGFSGVFEMFLKQDLRMDRFECQAESGSDVELFQQLCHPAYQPWRHGGMQSLKHLSRDVIRRHLHPQVSLIRKRNEAHFQRYFQYYNGIAWLNLPPTITDVITMKSLC